MKVLIIGAGGKTGKLVLDTGRPRRPRGHRSRPATRHKNEEHYPATVQVIHGDVRNPTRLDQVMAGQHAVIDAIGGTTPFQKTDLEASSARVILDVMKRNNVKRLIVSLRARRRRLQDHDRWLLRASPHAPFPRRQPCPTRPTWKPRVEHSGLDFAIVRPPVLSDSDATGNFYIVPPGKIAHKITRADLAQFLVDQLTSDTYLGQEVTIANS